MILRLLNWQGIAGIAVSLALAVLLFVQKAETRHWKTQSASFEQLYHQDQAAFATTVANYRAAAESARAADSANARRVAADQQSINERTQYDFEARLAAARRDAQRLRNDAKADSGVGGDSSMSVVSATAGRIAEGPVENRLSQSDALTATEQAIQLDELIKWIRAQAKVDPNAAH